VAVGAEDGGHVFRRSGRKVEVSAEEQTGSCFQGDVLDGIAGVTAPGVAQGVKRRPAGQGVEASTFQDSLSNRSPTLVPSPKAGDFLRDPVELGPALFRLEISSPAQGGLVLGIGGSAKADGADQESQLAGHAFILDGNSRSGREKRIRQGGVNREKDELHGTAAITEALRKRGFTGFYRIFARELEGRSAIIYYKLLIISDLQDNRQMDRKHLALETHSH